MFKKMIITTLMFIIMISINGCGQPEYKDYPVNKLHSKILELDERILIAIVKNTPEHRMKVTKAIDGMVKRLYYDKENLFVGINKVYNNTFSSEQAVRDSCVNKYRGTELANYEVAILACTKDNMLGTVCFTGTDFQITRTQTKDFVLDYLFDTRYTNNCKIGYEKYSLKVAKDQNNLLIYIRCHRGCMSHYNLRNMVLYTLIANDVEYLDLPVYKCNLK